MSDIVKSGTYIKAGVDEEIPFTYFSSPTTRQKLQFVTSVTEMLIGEHYHHIIKDTIFTFMLIDIFTDVDTDGIKDAADSIVYVEDLLAETNIIEVMLPNMEDGLIEELRDAVDKDIEYRTGIRANRFEDGLASILATIEEKIAGFDLSGMMDAAQALSGISDQITPEKMLEAYANTDMYKANAAKRDDFKVVKGAAPSPLMPLV